MKQTHPYHIIPLSKWPILTAFSLLGLTSGAVMYMDDYFLGTYLFVSSIIALVYCVVRWWVDVVQEAVVSNVHTIQVRLGLRIGMSIFLLSELMFFFAFFFAFFYASIFPMGILDGLWTIKAGIWPPKGIIPLDPWDIPLMNTLILLLSGTALTWANYELSNNNPKEACRGLGYAIILGSTFSLMQAYEYHHASFTFTQGIYASNFYMATGFHGAHVVIGVIFLTVCYFRIKLGHHSKEKSSLGFEFASWYWNFVDVIWLFLFAFIYVWGA